MFRTNIFGVSKQHGPSLAPVAPLGVPNNRARAGQQGLHVDYNKWLMVEICCFNWVRDFSIKTINSAHSGWKEPQEDLSNFLIRARPSLRPDQVASGVLQLDSGNLWAWVWPYISEQPVPMFPCPFGEKTFSLKQLSAIKF